ALVYGAAWASGPAELPANGAGWLAVSAIAVLSTLVAILFFFVGLGRLGAADASTVSTLEPLATIALAAVFLDERLSAMQNGGGAILVAAVILIARARDGCAART
ncbi:MAG TPA: DMT family transporter, partial [Rhodocyclaceae bacterium]